MEHHIGQDAADVIVVGGGVVGVCIAYYLTKSGFAVILIEKHQIGLGCSYGNACLITPSHSMPLPVPGVIEQAFVWLWHKDSPLLIRPRLNWQLLLWLLRFASNCRTEPVKRAVPVLRDLSRASLKFFDELIAAERLSFNFERRGLLSAYKTEQSFEKGRHEAELLASHGFNSKILDGPQARELEPALREGVIGGVYYPEDAHGDSYQFVSGMSEAIRKLGARIVTNTKVTRIDWSRDDIVRVIADGRHFSGKYLVVATGSWTPELAKGLGLSIPVQPGKGYSVTVDRPAVSPKVPIVNAAKKVVVTPLGNRLRFAGTMEFAGLDLTLNKTRCDAVLRGGLDIIPECGDLQNVERWCGLRPCTPDGLPIVDRIPHRPRIYIATGHAMLGYTLGPITGKLVAELIDGKQPSVDIKALQIDRF